MNINKDKIKTAAYFACAVLMLAIAIYIPLQTLCSKEEQNHEHYRQEYQSRIDALSSEIISLRNQIHVQNDAGGKAAKSLVKNFTEAYYDISTEKFTPQYRALRIREYITDDVFAKENVPGHYPVPYTSTINITDIYYETTGETTGKVLLIGDLTINDEASILLLAVTLDRSEASWKISDISRNETLEAIQ